MNRQHIASLLVVLALLCTPPAAMAIDAPHDLVPIGSGGKGYTCSTCHIVHRTAGTKGVDNICQKCHYPGRDLNVDKREVVWGDGSNFFGNNSTAAKLGGRQSSHAWTASDTVPAAGSQAPTSALMNKLSINGRVSCVRCHAIHNSANSTTTSKPYIRMMNDRDQLCLDCHRSRNTRDWRTGTHPVSFTYTSATSKARLNPSEYYYPTPQSANPANPTAAMKFPKGLLVCSTCHRVHAADSDSATFDSMSSTMTVQPSVKKGLGMLLRTDMRGAAVAGGQTDKTNICSGCHKKYNHNKKGQDIQCTDCHGGHVTTDFRGQAVPGAPNYYLVAPYFNYSANSATFSQPSLAPGFSAKNKRVFYNVTSTTPRYYYANSGNPNGLCQVCHKIPTSGYDSSHAHVKVKNNPDDPTVSDKSCRACHRHSATQSFTPPQDLNACGTCHGMPPILNQRGTIQTPRGGYAVYSGAGFNYNYANSSVFKDETKTPHKRHADGMYGDAASLAYNYNYQCTECHRYPGGHQQDTFQDVFGNLTGTVAFQPTLSGALTPYYTKTGSGSCASVYCHSNGAPRNTSLTAVVAYNSARGWTSTSDPNKRKNGCGTDYCHATRTTTLATNAHQKHINAAVGKSYSCALCHANTINTALDNYTSIKQVGGDALYGKHVNAAKDVDFDASQSFSMAAYNPATATCGTGCHGNGDGGSAIGGGVRWVDKLPTRCTGCHGGDSKITNPALRIATGKHQQHTDNAGVIGQNFRCADCHAKTVPFANNTTISTQARHVDGFKDYSGVKARGSAQYNAVTKTCSTNYCHSNGATVDGQAFKNPDAWNAAIADQGCNYCHGNKDNPGLTMSPFGEPNYDNLSTAQRGRFNAHNKHVSAAADCYTCHVRTVTTAGNVIQTLANYTSHINRKRDVLFDTAKAGASAAYSNATKKCSNVSCHGASTPRWGASFPTDCTGCHGNDNASSSPIATNKHTKHLNYGFACVECHARTVSDNRTVSNVGNHANLPLKDYSGVRAGRYNQTRNGCYTSYCHSTGQSVPVFIPMTTTATRSWQAGTSDCKFCHGAQSGGGFFTSQYGEPNYNNQSTATREKFNSHGTKHNPAVTDCKTCHYNTTRTGNSIYNNTTTHINKVRGVSFDTVAKPFLASATYDNNTKRCTNVYCHSNGKGSSPAIRWGFGSSTCGTCHAFPPQDNAHLKHLPNAGLLHQTYTSGEVWSTSGSYAFGCANCHPKDIARHIDGYVDITMNKNLGGLLRGKNTAANDTAGYNQTVGVSVRCFASYCHSNGMDTASPSFRCYTSPDWYGAFSGDPCATCHGNSPNSGGKIGSAAHYNTSGMGVSGKVTGHFVGIHYDNVFTNLTGVMKAGTALRSGHGNASSSSTISCDTCHYNTVNTAANDKNVVCASCHNGSGSGTLRGNAQIGNFASHLNGSIDVAFNPVRVKSKAQLRDTSLPSTWSRSGGYKGNAYDAAFKTLSTQTMWNSGTKNCSNIACHNGLSVTWTDTAVTCQSCHTAL